MSQQTQPTNLQPTNTEVRSSRPDALIGVFVLIAAVLLIGTIGWLKNFPLVNPPQRFRVMFHEVAGLTENAAIYVDGVRVGNVDSIRLEGKRNVAVALKINNDRIRIPAGSQFSILTNGLVGAKYIDIVLPEPAQGQQPQLLNQQSYVVGEDPERIELIVNELAHQMKKVDIDKTQSTMVATMQELQATSNKFYKLADRGIAVEEKVSTALTHADELSGDLRITTRKINRLLADPETLKDIKQTAADAKQTASTISQSIHELTTTLGDKPLRADLLTALNSMHASTNNLYNSVQTVDKISGNTALRSDIKDILKESRQTLTQVDHTLSNPGFKDNLGGTITKLNAAIGHMDLAAQQINQMLAERHPLIKMIFGRPGYIAPKPAKLSLTKEMKPLPDQTQPEQSEKGQLVVPVEKIEVAPAGPRPAAQEQ